MNEELSLSEQKAEKWKEIPGYEGLYEASNLGRVRSVSSYRPYHAYGKEIQRYHVGKIIKPIFDGRRLYQQVTLSKNGIHKRVLIHRLVALAFIPNPNSLPEVNHKDENKTNNASDNLEWCDHKYNNNYGTKKYASKGENNSQNKFSAQMVKEARSLFVSGDPQFGLTALSEKYGVSRTHMCAILKGRRWGWLE